MAVPHKTAVIIGSGFGATMTGLALAREFKSRNRKESILFLERGTWWTTPVTTVQDKEVKTFDFLVRKGQPVQYWSSQNHFRGFIDIFTRCFKRKSNEDGLYDFTLLGKRGFLGLFGGENDGVSIIRASGVGGGSLVYSNITIRPPDLVLDDPRWPVTWTINERNQYYHLARHAISFGVLSALDARAAGNIPYVDAAGTKQLPPGAINTGLSNIVMRTTRLEPHWDIKSDPNNSRGTKQIHLVPGIPPEQQLLNTPTNRLWLDRSRVFQTAASQLTSDFGAVDLAINDLTPEGTAIGTTFPPPNYPAADPKNYCERQGRCNVGCLPGARHTLNKQLMAAILGKPSPKEPDNPAADTPPFYPSIEIATLAVVSVIKALPEGGYEIRYQQRKADAPASFTEQTVTADIVVVAAGCLGTSEIMLRSKARGTLPNLSPRVGFGFSTNGDYIAFLEKTKERVSLTRGPVTTSFAHFNTTESTTGKDSSGKTFHTLEDQGIPPALAAMIGAGVPLIRSLAKGRHGRLFIIQAIFRWFMARTLQSIRAFFTNYEERGDIFRSEDEIAAKLMCVVAMGREGAVGQFRLGTGSGESPVRVKRTDGKPFYGDPIYDEIRASLNRMAEKLRDPSDGRGEFVNPFLNNVTGAFSATSIALSHPLGGCPMAKRAADGVVDEYGRVFDASKGGERPYYDGLYIEDGSFIPSALGVNPSLTISALALRGADQIIADYRARHS
jgi:choline dehydrogenase-like flavoprotein